MELGSWKVFLLFSLELWAFPLHGCSLIQSQVKKNLLWVQIYHTTCSLSTFIFINLFPMKRAHTPDTILIIIFNKTCVVVALTLDIDTYHTSNTSPI